MNNRGSAYVFVIVMTMGIMLMLTVVSTSTVYEAQISGAYKSHANLSALAYAGVERAVRAINLQLELERNNIAHAIENRILTGDEYAAIFIEEAQALLNNRFTGTEIMYTLEPSPDEIYTVRVRINSIPGGFSLRSIASGPTSDSSEEVNANVLCSGDANVVITENINTSMSIRTDIEYRIEKLKQNR